MSPADPIAGNVKLSKPAHRAMIGAGIVSFADLSGWTQRDVAALHGLGPATFVALVPAMAARGVSFTLPA